MLAKGVKWRQVGSGTAERPFVIKYIKHVFCIYIRLYTSKSECVLRVECVLLCACRSILNARAKLLKVIEDTLQAL